MSASAQLGKFNSVLGSMRLGVLGGGGIFSIQETLTITVAANPGGLVIASDTITIVDSVVKIPTVSAATALSISDIAVGTHVVVESPTTSLSIVDSASATGGNLASAADLLAFIEIITTDISPVNKTVVETLAIVDLAVRSVPTLDVTDTLSIVTSATTTQPDPVSDTLSIVDSASFVRWVFGGTPGYSGFHGFSDVLYLVQTVFVNQVLNLTASDSLQIADSVAAWVETGQDCGYAPFIGQTADTTVILPPATQPFISTGTLTLTWPFVSPTQTVVLRNPNYDNKFQYQPARINRTTRGGTLIVFADPIWTKLKKLEFTVTYLQGIQMQELQTFLLASVGQTIGLLDWEGVQWQGIITNPDADISNAQRGDWSIGLQFQGERVT